MNNNCFYQILFGLWSLRFLWSKVLGFGFQSLACHLTQDLKTNPFSWLENRKKKLLAHHLPRVQISPSHFGNCKLNWNVHEMKLLKHNENLKENS